MKLKTLLGYASGTAFGALLSFITLPALAWSFTQEDVGRLVMLQVACSLVAIIFSLGLDQSYVREFNEVDNKPQLAKSSLVPGFVLLILFCIIISFFHETVGTLMLGSSDTVYFLIAVMSFVMLYLERFFSVFIRMQEWAVAYSVAKILPKLFFLSIVLVAYFYAELQQIKVLLLVQGLSWFLAVAVMAFYLRKLLQNVMAASFTISSVKPLLYFGLPLVLNGIAFWGLTYVDRLMLAHYSSFSEVGLYAMAAGFAGVAMLFQQIFAVVWHPTIYRWVANGVQLDRVNAISAMLQLFSFVLIALVGCFAWLLPYFLPSEYAAIEFIIVACLVQPLFMMISEVSGIGISVSRATKFLPLITVGSLLLNVGLNIWLIPMAGAAGAAAATAISTGVYVILKTELSCRLWHSQPRLRLYSCVVAMLFGCTCHALALTEQSIYFIAMWCCYIVGLLFAFSGLLPQVKLLKSGNF